MMCMKDDDGRQPIAMQSTNNIALIYTINFIFVTLLQLKHISTQASVHHTYL